MLIATKGSKINISSKKKLEDFVKKIKNKIKPGNIIFLYGEMGVGKTTFAKYLINIFQLEYNEKLTEVTSPTFNILNEYQIKDFTIKHYDLYRLNSKKDLIDLNMFEKNEKSILLVEWPEIIKQKPNFLIRLFFEYENDYKDRIIKILD